MRVSTDRLVSSSAMFIGLATLFIDVSTLYQDREYHEDPYDFYLDVRPKATQRSLTSQCTATVGA